MSKKISRIRQAAFHTQGGLCWYCGRPMFTEIIPKSSTRRWLCTAEHLRPRSEGGADNQSNIRAVCLFCNQTRHRMKQVLEPDVYRAYVRRRMAKGKWHPH
ncbi:MAG: HNH endonuclease [Devosia sp.]|uniref:HNH endonuclease n=1 Tax=Devosia sp. TaxID=1871048 RepID=UPI0019FF7AD2|nr:HNH endonuclease [Devosia sp.]